ncbi:unnamed protein product [Cylicocyclus nassatus]|uniref:BTB domain-containing protein n=1 Tax=Cylicocyclus nassatus TaxID=53992 RepID=A0AA36DQ62_CYLNA|nr:unnamed protein product [Cylicocyclus nassatus]
MMVSTQEHADHQKIGERVKINVGGTIFETTISTLTRVDNSVLSAMVADRWRNQEEIFVDRNPTHFAKILDYLRDGENVVLPSDHDSREALRKEAEFYNLPGLAKMCVPCAFTKVEGDSMEAIKAGDIVHWRESVIEDYCIHFFRYLYVHDRWGGWSRCMSCGRDTRDNIGPTFPPSDDNGKKITISNEYWRLLKQHMLYMKGKATQTDMSCCEVQWGREMQTHVPLYALRLANSKNSPAQPTSS